MDKPTLAEHAVLYVDILGLRELMAAARTDLTASTDLLANYDAVMEKALSSLGESDRLSLAHRSMSDSFVLSVAFGNVDWESTLGTVSVMAAELQLTMTLQGWFLRGGFAAGPYYENDRIIFGPALLEAYEVETQIAVYPRIALTRRATTLAVSDMKNYAEPYKSPQNGYLLLDCDNVAFLNYLYSPIGLGQSCEHLTTIVTRHRSAVETALAKYADDPKLLAKYNWVASYHNFFVDTWLASEKALLIPEHLSRSRPRLIVHEPTRPEYAELEE